MLPSSLRHADLQAIFRIVYQKLAVVIYFTRVLLCSQEILRREVLDLLLLISPINILHVFLKNMAPTCYSNRFEFSDCRMLIYPSKP